MCAVCGRRMASHLLRCLMKICSRKKEWRDPTKIPVARILQVRTVMYVCCLCCVLCDVGIETLFDSLSKTLLC